MSFLRRFCLLSAAVMGLVSAPCSFAQGKAPVAQVLPEFRTAQRSLVTERVDRNRVVSTAGAISPRAARLTDVGETAASQRIMNMQLVLNRPAERQAAFDAQVEALHTAGNPSYHHWLTPALVGSEFGPSPSDVATLTGFLESEGFAINGVGKGMTYVDFSGTAAQVARTFHTTLHNYRLPTGDTRYSAIADAQIPQALAPLVAGFAGLSNIPIAHPNRVKQVPLPAPLTPRAGTGTSGLPVSKDGVFHLPQDTVASNNYAVGPQDFYTIYNENSLLNAARPINGSGVTIALLEEVRINPADVTTFRTNFQVTPNTPVSLVVENGYTGGNATAQSCTDPGANASSYQIEEEAEAILDTQWAGAVAPSANLLYVACEAGAIPLGTVIAAETVIDNNSADIMSMSYGIFEGFNPAEDTLVNQLWEQAASQGQVVVISSGDSGSMLEDQNYGHSTAQDGITVNGIASTAWNVSAGGTDFMDEFDALENDPAFGLPMYWNTATSTSANGFSSALSYIPEMTWNDNCSSSVYSRYYYGVTEANPATFCGANVASKNVTGGGGGPSTLHARPSWQTGTVYGLPNTTIQPNRLQPDISLFASNGFWFHSLPSYQSDYGGYGYAGGTSFVAPQLAGVFALVQQQTGERLGQPNYVLYAMAGREYGTASATGACSSSGSTYDAPATAAPAANCIFYDVQVGTNSGVCASGSPDCAVVSGASYGIVADPTNTGATPVAAYTTGIGYDMGTGIGTLNIANLVNNWLSASASTTFTPSVAVTPATTSYTYGSTPASITYTATVTGSASGSFPTGSVAFSGSPTIGAIGTAIIGQSAGCASNGTCIESAVQSYLPAAMLAPGTYTITGAYSQTNENYVAAAGTATITIAANPSSLSFSVPSPQNTASTVTLAATSNGSGAITYSLISGPAIVTGSTVTFTAAGSVTLLASQAADATYSATTATTTFTVGAGSVWLGNGAATVSIFDLLGNAVTTTAVQSSGAGTLTQPQTTGFDASGDLWIASTNGVSGFSPMATPLTTGPVQVGGISNPLALAIDGAGQIWTANGNGTVSVITQAGAAVSPGTGYTGAGLSTPGGMTIDVSGNVWVSNTSDNSVTEMIGAAAPASPPSTALANGKTGARP